jgi:polysaccharide biosynthesis protein PslJ
VTSRRPRDAAQPRRDITHYVDATTALTCYLVLLLAIPSRLVVGPLGAAGGVAALFSLSLLLWWGWFHLQRSKPSEYVGRRPVRTAVLVLLACVVVSYIAASVRPMPTTEVNGADNGLLRALGWFAVVVVANDGITDRVRFDVLIRRFVIAAALMAGLGLVQTFTGTTVVDHVTLPGLTSNTDFSGVESRNGFTRSTATAIHPLEYAVVLTAALPLAITRGLTDRRRGLVVRWLPAALIVVATLMSVSRTAIIGVVVALGVQAPAWPKRVRRAALFVGVLVLAAAYVLVPGLLGSIRTLLTGVASGDASSRSRTDSYATAFDFVSRSPLIGRGLGTFSSTYRILDNQLLLITIELGVLGLAALLALTTCAVWSALRARRLLSDEAGRETAQALAAAIISTTVTSAFFDAFGFPMAAGVYFLMCGLAGALHRIAAQQPPEPAALPRARAAQPTEANVASSTST